MMLAGTIRICGRIVSDITMRNSYIYVSLGAIDNLIEVSRCALLPTLCMH